jgi:hypothetical protein
MCAAMSEFLTGLIAMAFWVAGLFFLRFWRDTHDRLFLIFAAAFWILALTRVGLIIIEPLRLDENDPASFLFILRLIAYLLILYAIIDKNRLIPRNSAKPARDQQHP